MTPLKSSIFLKNFVLYTRAHFLFQVIVVHNYTFDTEKLASKDWETTYKRERTIIFPYFNYVRAKRATKKALNQKPGSRTRDEISY